MNSSYIQANIHIPLFFFSQTVTFKLSDFPMVLSLCYFTFCAHLNFGKHFSLICSAISNCRIKMQSMRLLAKLFISFVSLSALVLPVLSSPPSSQPSEATAFYLIWMKYSLFVRSPVLENIVYFAFCFITVKESMHMSSLFPSLSFLLDLCAPLNGHYGSAMPFQCREIIQI